MGAGAEGVAVVTGSCYINKSCFVKRATRWWSHGIRFGLTGASVRAVHAAPPRSRDVRPGNPMDRGGRSRRRRRGTILDYARTLDFGTRYASLVLAERAQLNQRRNPLRRRVARLIGARSRTHSAVVSFTAGNMGTLVTILIAAALAIGIMGSGRSGALRSASRGLASIGCAVFGLIAAASIYGAVALQRRGGGVLILVAIPAGIIAWLFFIGLQGSRGTEELFSLPPSARMALTRARVEAEIAALEERMPRLEEEAGRFWISAAKRRRLREELRNARVQLDGFRKILAGMANRPDAD